MLSMWKLKFFEMLNLKKIKQNICFDCIDISETEKYKSYCLTILTECCFPA